MHTLRFKLISFAVGLLAPWLLSLAPVSAAGAPELYFAQPAVTVARGSHVDLALHLNTNGTAIDTVNVMVSFPASQLTFNGLNKSGSSFDTTIPAAPTAKAGKLAFGASHLSGSVTGDTLIGTLDFTANAGSSVALVDLTGSQAASHGKTVSVVPGSASVTLAGQTGSSGSSRVGIGNITISNVTASGATINWTTTEPATSVVDYGADTQYGLTASNGKLSTAHHVDLGSVFRRSTIVHFRVSSADQNGTVQQSGDQTFTTIGYTILLKINNPGGQALTHAQVSVAGRPAVTTNDQGMVTVSNVAVGDQRVVINGGEPQTIAVKSLSGKAGDEPQEFTLTANNSSNFPSYLGIVLIVLALLLLGWLVRRSKGRLSAEK